MKNLKAILWDIDWVILTNWYSCSQHMQMHYLNNEDDMLPFFNWEFKETSIWKKDLKEILKSRLAWWNWTLWVDRFVDFWFLSEARTDPRVLELMWKFREKGVITCVASNQEKYRKAFLMNELWLAKHLDKWYFSCDLGVCKPDPSYYEKILADLWLEASEVLVIDDDKDNVVGAMSIWIQWIFYQEFSDLKELII